MERNIIFKCPRTGMNVQHWLSGATSDAADTHVSVRCPACAALHHVNIASGKTLSEGIGRHRATTAPGGLGDQPDPSRP
ncbi:putative C2H2 Zn-finger protein [Bradyrhizobium sp. USDA 4354]